MSEPVAQATRGFLPGRLRRAVELLIALAFAAMLGLFVANVGARFLFNRPIVWADEVLVLAMLWVTFLGAAFALDDRDHVAFDLVYGMAGRRTRRLMLAAGALATGAIFAAAAPGLLGYVAFLWRERTNVLEIRLDLAYAVFGVFVLALVVQRGLLVVRLWRADWERALDDVEGAAPREGDRR